MVYLINELLQADIIKLIIIAYIVYKAGAVI